MPEKELVVVGGPNGAGKTTFSLDYAALRNWAYLSADAIAAQLAPSDPASQQFAAGRRFLELVADAIAGDDSFIVESTLSGRTFCRWIQNARLVGFRITTIFLFLDSPDTCVARVGERVHAGGHDVPEHDIRRRYQRSIINFWRYYRPLSDEWLLTYNASAESQDIAVGTADSIQIFDAERFDRFLTNIEVDDD